MDHTAPISLSVIGHTGHTHVITGTSTGFSIGNRFGL